MARNQGRVAVDTQELLVEREASILRLTLNRPDSLNSAGASMLRSLAREVGRASRHEEVRTIVLTGAGRAFCSGADIGGGKDGDRDGGDNDTLAAANAAVLALRGIDKPVIAAVNGLAAGVGTSLALACDLVVAASSAYFLLAFTKIGLMPDGGATALIPEAVGRAKALRMALLAERIPARQAEEWGLISHVVPDEEFSSKVDSIAGSLASGAPLAFAETKRAINAVTLGHLTAALDRETVGQAKLSRTDDFREGVKAFRQKRLPVFAGK
jgi:enoyl-CoA hydratase